MACQVAAVSTDVLIGCGEAEQRLSDMVGSYWYVDLPNCLARIYRVMQKKNWIRISGLGFTLYVMCDILLQCFVIIALEALCDYALYKSTFTFTFVG